jgi:Mg2+ and Co2+ transporter CorA
VSDAPDAASSILSKIGLDRELIEDILESGHAPRIIPCSDGLVFQIPLEISGEPAELQSAAFICLERALITLRREVHEPSNWVDTSDHSWIDLGDGSGISLAGALMVELSVNLRRQSLEVRRKLADLADRLDTNPRAVSLEEIVQLKRKIFDVDAVSEEREAILESLHSANRRIHLSEEVANKLEIALGNTAATARRLERLDRRTEALQGRYDSSEKEKTNRRLSRLTVISAIFLPLTLIAGIYGMNFDVMPELHYPLAYPLALGGMVVLAIALYLWFRHQGWME